VLFRELVQALREEVRIKKEETGNRSGGKKVEGRRKN
jgi:hypothetical protein